MIAQKRSHNHNARVGVQCSVRMWGASQQDLHYISSLGVANLSNKYHWNLKHVWSHRCIQIDLREMTELNRCGSTEEREGNVERRRIRNMECVCKLLNYGVSKKCTTRE